MPQRTRIFQPCRCLLETAATIKYSDDVIENMQCSHLFDFQLHCNKLHQVALSKVSSMNHNVATKILTEEGTTPPNIDEHMKNVKRGSVA